MTKLTQKQFDVFLAHNSADKPQVRAIALELRKRGLKPWLDEEQIQPGRSFQAQIQKAIPQVKSAAIFIGSEGLGKWQIMELRSFISLCVEENISVIPVLLPNVSKFPDDLLFLRELSWLSFASRTDELESLDRLVWGITGRKPDTTNASNKEAAIAQDRQKVEEFAANGKNSRLPGTIISDREKNEFLWAWFIFVKPGVQLNNTYSQLLSMHYGKLWSVIERLEAENDWEKLLEVKIRLREFFEFRGIYNDAAKFGRSYVEALNHLDKKQEALWAQTKHVGYMLVQANEHKKARQEFKYVIQALGEPSKPIDPNAEELRFYCYRYMGISYQRDRDLPGQQVERLQKAEKYFTKADEVVKSLKNHTRRQKPLKARLLGNLGSLALDQGKGDLALKYSKESLQLFSEIEDIEHIGIGNLKIAEVLIEGNQQEQCPLSYLAEAERISIQLGWNEGQGRIAYLQARFHAKKAETSEGKLAKRKYLNEAIMYAKKSLGYFKSIDNQIWYGRTEELLKNLEQAVGQYTNQNHSGSSEKVSANKTDIDQEGNFGVGVTQGEISSNAKIAGIINEA
ncbi:MAG: toll/interleukin-1 receptor domain-containing protein [Xenococcaceae cyanobacterium MO_188.B32]|nr:toll/interleukin-1 receptor domain-containing protein [Xenococcaceae cyanobacterium MO_188.B32]